MNIDAIRDSWLRVAALGDLAARHFYATLFLLAPDLRPLFPPSMSAQNDKLLAALGHIVSNVDRPEIMGAFAAHLGADHRRFAVTPSHYAVVGQALLATLEKLHGPSWTPELARDWGAAYDAVANAMIEGAESSSQPPVWRCKVIDVVRPTPDIIRFAVQPDHPLRYRPGQSVPARSPRMRNWRYLSPANAARFDARVEFHVRAAGADSASLVQHLDLGDELLLGQPVGDAFQVDPLSTGELLMVAGGTGVAPMRAILDGMGGRRVRPTTLIFGARTPSGLYCHQELRQLAATRPWLTYIPTVEYGTGWSGQVGTAVETALGASPWARADILVCGSPDMVTRTVQALLRHSVPRRRIFTECLNNAQYPPLGRVG